MIWRLFGGSPGEDRAVLLPPGDHILGSGANCDVRIADSTISRRHARLRVDRSGVEVVDLDSKNGTWVDGVEVDSCQLVHGSSLALGAVKFEMQHLDADDVEIGVALHSLTGEASSISRVGLTGEETISTGGLGDWLSESLAGLAELVNVASLQEIAVRGSQEIQRFPGTTGIEISSSMNGTPAVLYSQQHGEPNESDEDVALSVAQGSFEAQIQTTVGAPIAELELAARCVLALLSGGERGTKRPVSDEVEPPSLPEPTTQDLSVLAIYERAQRAARSEMATLIRGETGTGKEVLARYLHAASPRADQPFIAVNCAALPRDLLEAELFGIERGVATGVEARQGCLERAHRGTLFLDEIGDMPIDTQAMILRALQEKEIHRVGGTRVREADVWVLSATNRDLDDAMTTGDFRRDLWFRIATWSPELPALRHRRVDIGALAVWFVGRESQRLGKKIRGLSKACLAALDACSWPGNIRQLEHEMKRAVAFCPDNGLMDTRCLSEAVLAGQADDGSPLQEKLQRLERREIESALRRTDGDVESAAVILGLKRATMYRRLKALDIETG